MQQLLKKEIKYKINIIEGPPDRNINLSSIFHNKLLKFRIS